MILVTGGTGLVGSHLLYQLIIDNNSVRAIYRNDKKLDIVKQVFSYYSSDSQLLFNKIEWVQSDLLDIPSLSAAFDAITHVYHCAAFVSFEPDKYRLLRRTNIEGTANIVNLCNQNSIKKLCYVSSIAALGENLDGKAISEETHWNPEADNSVYGITKFGAEMEVWRATQEGLDVVIVNPGVILGSGIWRHGSGSLINKVYKGLGYYTSGSVGYIDVKDVVSIMIKLMNSTIKNERFILVAENWTYEKFLKTVAKYLQVKSPDKVAKLWMLQLGWKLDWMRHKLTGKRRRLTKQFVTSLVTKSEYSNAKINKHLDLDYIPIEDSIANVSQQFLKEL